MKCTDLQQLCQRTLVRRLFGRKYWPKEPVLSSLPLIHPISFRDIPQQETFSLTPSLSNRCEIWLTMLRMGDMLSEYYVAGHGMWCFSEDNR